MGPSFFVVRVQLSRFSVFRELRTIYFSGTIDEQMAAAVIDAAETFMTRRDHSPIKLVFDTPGGHHAPMCKLTGFVRASPAPIWGIIRGRAFSAGFHLLWSCAERYATPESLLMYHPPQVPSKEICPHCGQHPVGYVLDENEERYQTLLGQISAETRTDLALVQQWGREERRFTAAEAKKLRMIKRIVKRLP